jgi:hypothetical protein
MQAIYSVVPVDEPWETVEARAVASTIYVLTREMPEGRERFVSSGRSASAARRRRVAA